MDFFVPSPEQFSEHILRGIDLFACYSKFSFLKFLLNARKLSSQPGWQTYD